MNLQHRRKRKRILPARIKEPLETPEQLNHTWSMDFMHDVLEKGRKVRTLNIRDDYNREAIAQEVAYSQNYESVIRTLENLIIERDEPLRIRTDNGPEFISKVFQEWCSENDIINSYTQPGKPTQNAYIERFNRTYREDILDAYLSENIEQLRFLTQQFRLDYNENHPHKSLGGLSPIKYAMNSGKLSKFTTIHSLTG